MIDFLWPFALFLVLAAVGLPSAFAALIAGAAGLLALYPLVPAINLAAARTGAFVGPVEAGIFVLLLLGGWLQGLGAVQTFPEREPGAPSDVDREAWFSGGTLGAPLPVAASLVVICLLVEQSIGEVMVAALLPAVVLTAGYWLLFLLLLLRGGGTSLRRPEGGANEVAIVFRILVPIVALLVVYVPVHVGWLTPNEAFAVAFVLLLIPVLLCAGLTPGGWRMSGRGLLAGAVGAGSLAILLVGILLFSIHVQAAGGAPYDRMLAAAGAPPWLVFVGLIAATILAGIALGPLGAVGLAVVFGYPVVVKLGIDGTVFAVALFLAAEAVRVGPMLWRDGFVRSRTVLQDGTVAVEGGAWPYYLLALVVVFGYSALSVVRF
jgi:TRAP-type C4-dicarboxylate transport system permease large subunit